MPDYPEGYEPELGGLHGFFSGLIDEGYSQNRALRTFREAGGAGSNTFLRNLYNETLNNRQLAPEGWERPLDYIPGAGDFAPWQGGKPGMYGYPIDLQAVTDTGDIEWVSTMLHTDRPLSKADAFSLAIDQYLSGSDPFGNPYHVDVVSAELRGQPFEFTGGFE